MNKKAQLVCLWSAALMGLLVTIGWWPVAGFVPPPPPSWSAAETAAFFAANTNGIRTGLLLMLAGVGFFIPFIALISMQMRRMEHTPPVLAYTQLLGGSMSVMIILVPIMLWTTAAFRPERVDVEITQMLNDAAWLIVAMTFAPGIMQNLSIGLAVLWDKGAKRVFPRWVAYVNFWMALGFLPAGLMTYFKTGPFAWNGILAFWLPLVAFAIWFNVMFIALQKAIKEQQEA
ncbi:MAG TPA: hypothetical protein VK018_06280 [Porticoccaceae bacterium]|nr:hypothetical protein [Pseudomonadota bacterium]HLS98315.1 hypothetical protein [Porticoccaceae bacterium]